MVFEYLPPALTCIANIGTPEMAEEVGDDVPRILVAP